MSDIRRENKANRIERMQMNAKPNITFLHGNCTDVMSNMIDNYVDYSFTSPPHNRKRNDKYQEFMISKGFDECMRVLKPQGSLIFKWNEHEIKSRQVLDLIPYKPLFGHTSGKKDKTIWMAFMKGVS